MASPAQTLTNQQNAKLSTGPRTPEGKRQSSLNALRHGLTSQTVVLPGEDAEAYAAFHAILLRDFAPVGSAEQILVETIAQTQWRLERSRNLEASLTALAQYEEIPADIAAIEDPALRKAMLNAHGYDKREKKIRNLQLHESRLQRTLFKAMADLEQAQAARREREHFRLAEAIALRKQARQNNLPFDLSESGFDFTNAQLDREEHRRSARKLEHSRPANTDWSALLATSE